MPASIVDLLANRNGSLESSPIVAGNPYTRTVDILSGLPDDAELLREPGLTSKVVILEEGDLSDVPSADPAPTDGTRFLLIRGDWDGGDNWIAHASWKSVPVIAGVECTLRFDAYKTNTRTTNNLQVNWGTGNNNIITSAGASLGWNAGSLAFTPATSPIDLDIRCVVGSGATNEWLLDNIRLEQVPVITKQITDAVKLDLDDISIATGYSLDVNSVTTGEEDIYKVATPGIIWRPAGSGDSDLDTHSDNAGVALQRYAIELSARSLDDLHNLFDDVRNAIEHKTAGAFDGNVMTLADVVIAGVSDWSGVERDEDRWVMACVIDVTYGYERGAA